MKTNKKKIIGGYSKFEKMDFPFIYLLIAIPVLHFIVFWVYVNSSSIVMAFQDSQGAATFNNFREVWQGFTDRDMFGISLKDSLFRSLILWFCGQLVVFPISVITTYVLAKKILGHYVFRICYLIPGLMGSIIWVALIRYMFHYDGPVVELLINLGVDLPMGVVNNGLLGAEETAFPSILAVYILMGLVGQNAVMTGAFSRVPNELFESARLDGAGFWRECFSIAIPCVWSTISTLLTFALCGVLTADYNVFLFTDGNGGPNQSMSTIGYQLYNLTFKLSNGTSTNYGYPSALGLTLTILTLPIVLIGRKVLDKLQETVEV